MAPHETSNAPLLRPDGGRGPIIANHCQSGEGHWLKAVISCYFAYHRVPTNLTVLAAAQDRSAYSDRAGMRVGSRLPRQDCAIAHGAWLRSVTQSWRRGTIRRRREQIDTKLATMVAANNRFPCSNRRLKTPQQVLRNYSFDLL